MRLIDKEHKHPAFDAPSGMAAALLATGTVEVYKSTPGDVRADALLVSAPLNGKRQITCKEDHVVHFQVVKGPQVDDVKFPPEIHYSCAICGNGQITGKNSQQGKVFHHPPFGHVSYVPLALQKEFIAERKEYDRKRRNS